MAQASRGMGLMIGSIASCALVAIAAASVLTGDLNLQFAGIQVNVSNQTERGFVVMIDGGECPGAGCPAFAFDWKLARQG